MMNDNSHTAHEPYPTAAMDRQLKDLLYRPNEDTVFMSDFNEDEVIHIESVGKRKVYSEAAYNKLLAKRDRLRDLVEEAYREGWDSSHPLEHLHTSWLRSNTYVALQEDRDDTRDND